MYVTDGFAGHGAAYRWALRTDNDPTAYLPAVRTAVADVASHVTPAEVATMESLLARAEAPTRFALQLISALASMSVLLVLVGLYGVLSTTVTQRRTEIGVRMALGETPAGVSRLVLSHGMRLSMFGIAIGATGAVALSRVMTSMLVGIDSTDLITYAAVTMLFIVVATVACFVPARRAAMLDPVAILRE